MADAGFRVAGVLDKTLYEVEVTGDPAAPVVGSKRVKALLEQRAGESVMVTPAGPAYKVDVNDPVSILALLVAHTKVTRVSEDAPPVVEPRPAGAVW